MCLVCGQLKSWQDYRATASYKYTLSDVPREVEGLGKTALKERYGHIQHSVPELGKYFMGLGEEKGAQVCPSAAMTRAIYVWCCPRVNHSNDLAHFKMCTAPNNDH